MSRSYIAKLIALVGLWSLLFCPETWAEVETMESSVLRVEVTASPYSFRIVERWTGEVACGLQHDAPAQKLSIPFQGSTRLVISGARTVLNGPATK